MKKESQYFIEACFAADMQRWYQGYIDEIPARKNHFYEKGDPPDNEWQHKYWSPSPLCYISGEKLSPSNIGISVSYWTPFLWRAAISVLIPAAIKQERAWCKAMDRSCSDCIHLTRLGYGKANRCFHDWCEKKEIPTNATPNVCNVDNIHCFQQRK